MDRLCLASISGAYSKTAGALERLGGEAVYADHAINEIQSRSTFASISIVASTDSIDMRMSASTNYPSEIHYKAEAELRELKNIEAEQSNRRAKPQTQKAEVARSRCRSN